MRSFDGATLVPLDGRAPEDVLVGDDGRVYAGLEDGRVVRVAGPGAPVETVARLPGRPLGLEFLGSDELLVCASDAGLLAVGLADGRVRTVVDRVDGRPLLGCNNAAVADDGTIYFSESSTRFPVPRWREDLIEQTRTGRLFRRAPDGAVTEILGGLDFANGVALSADGSFVVVAETGSCRLQRVWLTGDRAGRAEVFVADVGGHPDNVALGSDGLLWVAIAGPRAAVLERVQRLPAAVRAVVRRIPERLQPRPDPAIGVVAVDDAGVVVHELRGVLAGFEMLSAVREVGGALWLGSLSSEALATLRRDDAQPGGAAPSSELP
jgi:sugar lactone lactonase YvrE